MDTVGAYTSVVKLRYWTASKPSTPRAHAAIGRALARINGNWSKTTHKPSLDRIYALLERHGYSFKKRPTESGPFSFLSAPVKLIGKAAKIVVPVVSVLKTAASLVPGAGTGIAAALSAAESLAKGQPITEALLDAAQDAMPGGSVARMAFRTAVTMARGERVDAAVLDAAKAELPDIGQKAFDVGVGLAEGRKIQRQKVERVERASKDSFQVLKAGQKPPIGIPIPRGGEGGFKIAMGVLESKTITPVEAMAIRNRLTARAKRGWDTAMRRYLDVQKQKERGSPGQGKPRVEVRVWNV